MFKSSLPPLCREQLELARTSSSGRSVQVLSGRVRLGAGDDRSEGAPGGLLVVPDHRHDLQAIEDSVVLLTVVEQS